MRHEGSKFLTSELSADYRRRKDFYKGRLVDGHGLGILVPGVEDRNTAHRVIYDERLSLLRRG